MDPRQTSQPEPTTLEVLSGRYALHSLLGEGSFGKTYLGEHLILKRRVAIKILAANQPDAAALFRNEARITATLDHPNILKSLEAGISDDGRPYYVTEWVDGSVLSSILPVSGPLGTREALEVAVGVAEALHYVHGMGILHRDLKPSNILIPGWPANPHYREPKVLDFGVAGRLDHGVTRVGMIFGTPQYMSPEQLMGQQQSPATDVYGLGLLLFEMLLGHPPLSRLDDAFSLARAIVEGQSVPELSALAPDIADLIRRCISRKPADRPSVDQVLEELGRLALASATSTWPRRDSGVPSPHGRDAQLGMTSLPPRALPPGSRSGKTLTPFGRRVWGPLIFGIALLSSIFLLLRFYPIPLEGPIRMVGLIGGVFMAVVSVAVGFWLRSWLASNSSAKSQAYELLVGAKSRADLTATIALQLDELVSKLRALDERILAGSVALMLNEYGRATDAKDRQAALMNVVALSEKLALRLSPWYERYKDVIASAVAVMGGVSGLVTAINSVLGSHKH